MAELGWGVTFDPPSQAIGLLPLAVRPYSLPALSPILFRTGGQIRGQIPWLRSPSSKSSDLILFYFFYFLLFEPSIGSGFVWLHGTEQKEFLLFAVREFEKKELHQLPLAKKSSHLLPGTAATWARLPLIESNNPQ